MPIFPNNRFALVILVNFIGCLVFSTVAVAVESEYAVKASFVKNFLKYISVPDVEKELRLCTLIHPELQKYFDPLSGQVVYETLIVINHLGPNDPTDGCHALFVARTSSRSSSDMPSKSILTIGETQNFLEQDGIIQFLREGSKIRFRVNLKAARARRINIDSRLLRLAKEVIQ